MRLEIQIDGYGHMIDTVDPEMLGRWMVEIFNRFTPMSPASYVNVRAWPTFNPKTQGRDGDWIADTRYNRNVFPRSPRELLEQLGEILDEMEADKAASG